MPRSQTRETVSINSHHAAPQAMRRNMLDPLPIVLLGRLAIDQRYHDQGIGQALLWDAMLRTVHLAAETRVFAILVHALSDTAKQFYLSGGFIQSPIQPMTLMMILATTRIILIPWRAKSKASATPQPRPRARKPTESAGSSTRPSRRHHVSHQALHRPGAVVGGSGPLTGRVQPRAAPLRQVLPQQDTAAVPGRGWQLALDASATAPLAS